MADRATQSLEHITGSGEYVLVPDFVVFDEHDEFDEDGKLLRRFDRKRLQTIVDKCNHRAEHSGDLATIAPGHSLDDPKSEEDQPPPWGFGINYRLGNYGPGQKLGILCDAYVRKQIRTRDGRMVDGPEYVASFPRRSPELWPNHSAVPEHARNTFDWIAVLRRAPQRDLGLSVYHRHYSAAGALIGGITRKHKLRYQMEAPMPNPVDDPEADVSTDLDAPGGDPGLDQPGGDPPAGAPPEGHEEFAKHLDYAMVNHPHLSKLAGICKKYAMDAPGGDAGVDAPGGDAPLGATNAALPGGEGEDDGDPALMQNQRKGKGDVRKTKTQLQLDAQEKRIKATEAEMAIERKRLKVERYRMGLEALSARGIEVDVELELDDCVSLDQAGYDKHLARIERYSMASSPVGGDMPLEAFDTPAPGTKDLNDPKVEGEIHRYMRANPEFVQKHGSKAFHEAARILKFIS
jgi:hypothetical protein